MYCQNFPWQCGFRTIFFQTEEGHDHSGQDVGNTFLIQMKSRFSWVFNLHENYFELSRFDFSFQMAELFVADSCFHIWTENIWRKIIERNRNQNRTQNLNRYWNPCQSLKFYSADKFWMWQGFLYFWSKLKNILRLFNR